MFMFQSVLDAVTRMTARLWNRNTPEVAQDVDSPSHTSSPPLSRGADRKPDRAHAPKTADLPILSERLSPSRAAPRPPSRHRPGTPLDPPQQSCAYSGPDAELFQQGGEIHHADHWNKPRSYSTIDPRDRCFHFISTYLTENGVSPTYAEIMAGAGISSKSGVYRHVWALARQGKLTVARRQRRAITLVSDAANGLR